MNLPITTLEDAWGDQNSKLKQMKNKYKSLAQQENMISKMKFNNMNFNYDNTFSNNDIDVDYKILDSTYDKSINTSREYTNNVAAQQSESYNKLDNFGVTVTVTDPKVNEYLSKFNEEYKLKLINRVLKEHIENPKVETFMSNMSDLEIYLIVGILCFMLYEKITNL
tara:strand:+ start:2892 stop:3392 length:501 start_codon:yes stop_codon:yes gene_type:complete